MYDGCTQWCCINNINNSPERPCRILCFAQRVKKTSGGRAWLPKWGLTGAVVVRVLNLRAFYWLTAQNRVCMDPVQLLLPSKAVASDCAGLNQTQKATRRKNRGQEQDLAAALKQAAAGDPKALEQAAA